MQPGDTTDYNSDSLLYASVRIANKTKCIEAYRDLPKLHDTINKYMVCTIEAGNIDDEGNIILPSVPVVDGCHSLNATLRSEDVCKIITNI